MKVIIKFEDIVLGSKAINSVSSIVEAALARLDLELFGLKLMPMSVAVDRGHYSKYATVSGAVSRVVPLQKTFEIEFLIMEEVGE